MLKSCYRKIYKEGTSLSLLGEIEGKEQRKQASDGSLVSVGNADAKGANVNNWKPDNSNDNLGVVFSRKFYKPIKGSPVKGEPLIILEIGAVRGIITLCGRRQRIFIILGLQLFQTSGLIFPQAN